MKINSQNKVLEQLQAWNKTTIDYQNHQVIHQLFEAQVERTPEATALIFAEKRLSYQVLNRRANQLAHFLREAGLAPKGLVGLYMDRSFELVVSILAILKAGGAYIPLDPNIPRLRLQQILQDTNPAFLLLAEKSDEFQAYDGHKLHLDALKSRLEQESAENLSCLTTPVDLINIVYTSASTGTPKGARIPISAVLNRLFWMWEAYPFHTNDVLLFHKSCALVAATWECFGGLLKGIPTLMVTRQDVLDPAILWQKLVNHDVSYVLATPALWQEVLDQAEQHPGQWTSLRLASTSAEPLSPQMAQRWLRQFPEVPFLNLYGATECSSNVTVYDVRQLPSDAVRVPIGKPFANNQIYILDEELLPTPLGEVGEMCIAGACLAQGYHNLPDLTQEHFIKNPFAVAENADDMPSRLYKTGDLARYLSDGAIELVGRKDHQVKIRGFRVELGDVEIALTQHEAVQKCAVILSETERDKYLISYVCLSEAVTATTLRRFLQARLPEYMIPVKYIRLDVMPLTANGKIDRLNLPKPDTASLLEEQSYVAPQNELEQIISSVLAEVLSVPQVSTEAYFLDLGLHSLLMAQAQVKLSQEFNRNIPITALLQHSSVRALATYLSSDPATSSSAPATAARTRAEKLRTHRRQQTSGIAIIGMACRFPGARNLDEFWQNLQQGIESLTFFSDEELAASGVDPAMVDHPDYVKAGAILADVDQFDTEFFGLNPTEAAILDPQQRFMLECAWEALEHSGYSPDTFAGSIGVYAGARISEYLLFNQPAPDLAGLSEGSLITNFQRLVGNDKDYLSTRISFKLNLTGPSLTVQTACSSSLVAVHLATKSLLAGECDMALAGGVSIRVPQKAGYLYSEGMIFSPDGHTRAFDAEANGTHFSSGAGLVVLKRLEDAQADGDTIYAVIRGSAINNDGATGKAGYTAPSLNGQVDVISQALAMAEMDPDSISYIETHGTGTALGDVIEIGALNEVFPVQNETKHHCALGAVKNNIGHTVQAAGVAGLIKTALMIKHQKLVPTPNFVTPNPQLHLAESPFFINTELTDWLSTGQPRRAGLSSFGVGGTNAHVILEEPPQPPNAPTCATDQKPRLLAFSARSDVALRAIIERYAQYLSPGPNHSLANICFTVNTGRTHFDQRVAVMAESTAELARKLTAFLAGEDQAGVWKSESSVARPKIAFLFTGQGAQYVEMGYQLYQSQPVFQAAMDRCAKILDAYIQFPLLDILYPPEAATSQDLKSKIDQTAFTQPALFAIEYALAQLWLSWGVKPDFVLGHSVGEYTAACVAGVFSLEDGLRLIAERGRLMQALPAGGEMAVIFAGEHQVTAALTSYPDQVSIAASNGPQNTVISGRAPDVQNIVGLFQAEGIRTQFLTVSHAFHSPLMRPMLDDFAQTTADIVYQSPQINLISNLTGQKLVTAPDADYWQQQVCEPVKFAAAMETLQTMGCDVLLELGPQPTLLGMGRRCWPEEQGLWLPSLRKGRDDEQQMLASLAQLYTAGLDINWAAVESSPTAGRQRVPLPTYPFQRQRYWLEPMAQRAHRVAPPQTGTHLLLGERVASPLRDIQFQIQLDSAQQPFLTEHRIFEQIIFPATGFVEMVCVAATEALDGKQHSIVIEELLIQEALVLDEVTTTLQLILSPTAAKAADFQIFSLTPEGTEEWRLHVSGRVALEVPPKSPAKSIQALQACCSEIVSIDAFYGRKRQRGLYHGASFQGVVQAWRSAEAGQALGQIQPPASLQASLDRYHLHPALLDAAIQMGEIAFPGYGAEEGAPYLPMIWENIRVYGPLRSTVWSQVIVRSDPEQNIRTIDVFLLDDVGQPLVEVVGLHFKQATPATLSQRSLQTAAEGWLHTVAWESQPLAPQPAPPGPWLIFAEDLGIGHKLAEALLSSGQQAVIVKPGDGFRQTDSHYLIDPDNPAHFSQLFSTLRDSDLWPSGGIVYLWGLSTKVAEDFQAIHRFTCGGLLHLAQALAKGDFSQTRLWLVTRGSQRTGTEFGPLALGQTPLWGLGRVLINEQPQLACTLLDLDPSEDDLAVQTLLTELQGGDGEPQIAWRGKDRYVARLTAPQTNPDVLPDALTVPENKPYQLHLETRGDLGNMTLKPVEQPQPGPGEVVIQVAASGLNFRDVLNALDQLPGDIGRECSGTIAACGPGVTDFQIGDAVLAVFSYNCFSSFVTVDARYVAPKPAHLSYAAAATIPIVFLTAYYCLHHVANISSAKCILIHAASGGLGLAALQLAQQAGLEVYATASPPKWAYLKSLGVKHVFNSRALDFADEILALTHGKGVDIVLNSLTGDFIPKSLSVLGVGGYFIELGASDSWSDEQVAALRPDINYTDFQLPHTAKEDPATFQRVFHTIIQQIDQGLLKPLPHRTFPIQEAVRAFRTMAQAKHIGKIVITSAATVRPNNNQAATAIGPDKTYLITGGLGGLGLKVAAWLVAEGARSLVLLGRSHPSALAAEQIRHFESLGAQTVVAQVDVADDEQMVALMEQIGRELPPLRGVVHAAGVLDDGLLPQQTWSRFEQVMRPKVAGAWVLHHVTEQQPLDFFVLFSSTAALLGGPAQGSYAAANAFLDGLAHYRQERGLPALTINWGPWSEVGMAASLDTAIQQQRARRGMGQILPEQGLYLLGQLVSQGIPQAVVMPIDWEKYLQQFPETPKYFSRLAAGTQAPDSVAPSTATTGDVLDKLATAPHAERQQVVIRQIRDRIGRLLGVTAQSLAQDRSLLELGVDSLTVLELRNRILADFKIDIPIVKFMEGPPISTLANMLLEALEQQSSHAIEPISSTVGYQQQDYHPTDNDWEEGAI